MKYVIDEAICKKEGMDLPSLFAVLLVKTTTDIPQLFKQLEDRQVIVKDLLGVYSVTQRWDDTCANILLSSDKDSIPLDDRIEKLATQLMDIMPQGKKTGTVYYFKGNKREITLKLKKFFKIYGDFTDEQIIDATKRYVASFNGNYSYMRLLKYFIWKSVTKIGEDGRGYIEEVSELADYIANTDIVNTNEDWTANLV